MKLAIVGCGPAGLASALLLHRQGHQIVLFERFDTPRPIGSGIILQPTGQAVLKELQLSDEIYTLGKRLQRINGVAMPSNRRVLQLDYSTLGENFHGLAVHRAALFEVLFDAVVDCNIEIRTNTVVSAPLGREFDLTIDASGSGSLLRPYSVTPPTIRPLKYGAIWGSLNWPDSGFDGQALQQRYVAAHTMIGVMPIGQHSTTSHDQSAFFWSLKTQDYARWKSEGLEQWKDQVLSIWPQTESLLSQITDTEQMTLAQYKHCTLGKPYGKDIVFIGDAAHATSPQLGQGANMALLDAWSLAESFATNTNTEAAVIAYARSRRWHVKAFQLSSLLMTPFYQSDSKILAALRDLLFDPTSKLPIVRRIVAGLVSGMLAQPPKSLDYYSPPPDN